MNLSDKQINEIAQELDMRMDCYIHKTSGEVITMIDFDTFYDGTELWEEEYEKIQENRDQYIRIEKISSHDSFKIMRRFLGTVSNENLRNKLLHAISQNKPFRKFRDILDYNGDVLQDWYQFKQEQMEQYVRSQIRLEMEEEE